MHFPLAAPRRKIECTATESHANYQIGPILRRAVQASDRRRRLLELTVQTQMYCRRENSKDFQMISDGIHPTSASTIRVEK